MSSMIAFWRVGCDETRAWCALLRPIFGAGKRVMADARGERSLNGKTSRIGFRRERLPIFWSVILRWHGVSGNRVHSLASFPSPTGAHAASEEAAGEVHDLLASKLAAARLKDLELTGALLKLRLARARTLRSRIAKLLPVLVRQRADAALTSVLRELKKLIR